MCLSTWNLLVSTFYLLRLLNLEHKILLWIPKKNNGGHGDPALQALPEPWPWSRYFTRSTPIVVIWPMMISWPWARLMASPGRLEKHNDVSFQVCKCCHIGKNIGLSMFQPAWGTSAKQIMPFQWLLQYDPLWFPWSQRRLLTPAIGEWSWDTERMWKEHNTFLQQLVHKQAELPSHLNII